VLKIWIHEYLISQFGDHFKDKNFSDVYMCMYTCEHTCDTTFSYIFSHVFCRCWNNGTEEYSKPMFTCMHSHTQNPVIYIKISEHYQVKTCEFFTNIMKYFSLSKFTNIPINVCGFFSMWLEAFLKDQVRQLCKLWLLLQVASEQVSFLYEHGTNLLNSHINYKMTFCWLRSDLFKQVFLHSPMANETGVNNNMTTFTTSLWGQRTQQSCLLITVHQVNWMELIKFYVAIRQSSFYITRLD
jgi:hypothetical protein